MPRKRKGQAVAVPTGLPYGQGEKIADAQRQQPLPQVAGSAIPAPTGGGGGPLTPAPAAAPVDPMQAAIAAAQSMEPPAPGGLAAPGDPNIPITAGLQIGAGAGPAAMGLPVIPEEEDSLNALIRVWQLTGSPAVERYIHVIRSRAEARHRMLERGQRRVERRSRFQ